MVFKNIFDWLKHELSLPNLPVKSLLSEILSMMNGKQRFG
jgi:hypothetical protein